EGGAAVGGEARGFGFRFLQDGGSLGFGALGLLPVFGQKRGSFGRQAPCFLQFGGDAGGTLVQHRADHARNALPQQQGDDQDEADGNPEFGIVQQFHRQL